MMKALYTSIALLFFILFFSLALHHTAAAAAAGGKAGESRAWQQKTPVNHGSFRGPRKHLVDPTATTTAGEAEQLFLVPKLPV
ncbi:putative Transmembrane protein [Melia azedarach]|uniref:Transmembrane protein n=1 Tax=Melia azedarach TaxID=155640 RepID=A0ACC1YXX1_MELAZ|nr:putative Transmembrane protein [Melia azedarach]